MEALKRLKLCRTDERLWLSIATKRRLADDRSLLEYVGVMKLVGRLEFVEEADVVLREHAEVAYLVF